MRYYVKFDGKNAVPEWVEDCFDCVRSEDGKRWAFFYGETLWEAETDAHATVFRNRNNADNGKAVAELFGALRVFEKYDIDELRMELDVVDSKTVTVKFYYDN